MVTKPDSKRIAVVILGMHRSGTSALAGTLGLLGCRLPQTLMAPTADNARGYFEAEPLHKVHTRLLDSAGSHWSDWLPIRKGWFSSPNADEFVDEISNLVMSEFGNSRQFLLKDPRICRLMPLWDRVFDRVGASARYVHIHRNPLEVASSLKKRDAIEIDLGLLIWLRHMLDSEAGSRGRLRSFTTYGRLLESWGQVAGQIEHSLEITLPRLSPTISSEVDAFLGGEMRHHVESESKMLHDPMVLEWARNAYKIFEHWAGNGENQDDHVKLDQIRADMDKTGPIFARIIQNSQANEHTIRRMISDTKILEQQLTRTEILQKQAADDSATIARLTEERLQYPPENFRELQIRVDDLTETLAARDASLTTAAAEYSAREKGLQAELADNAQQMQGLEQRLAESRTENAELTRIIREKEFDHFSHISALQTELKETTDRYNERDEGLLKEIATGALHAKNLEQRLLGSSGEIAELTRIIFEKETIQNKRLETLQDELKKSKIIHNEREAILRSEVDTGVLNTKNIASRLAESKSEIDDLKQIILDKETAHAKYVSSLQQRSAYQETYIEALKNSSSWKITAPTRWIMTIVRKALKR